MDFFKNFFKNDDRSYFSNDSENFSNKQNDTTERFDVFPDPMKMQQFFENQINEMLKSFHIDEFSTFFSAPHDFPPRNYNEQQGEPLRDHFLKDGYQKKSNKIEERADQDLDDKVKNGNLGSLLEDKSISDIQPYSNQRQDHFFSSQSHSFKLKTLPDGTVQTENTIKDNKGNEETTICHKLGDKEYCVIQKRDKHGKEEVTEKFTNISENEQHDFKETYRKFMNDPPNFPFDFFR